MVFFRLGKLDRVSGATGDKDAADAASGAGCAASVAPIAAQPAPGKDQDPILKERSERKKKDTAGPLPGAGAPGGADVRAAGPARSQAGLSVNDFISKTKNQQRQGVKPSGPELIAYARYLGIDPVADHDLLWIAVEALEAPLPSDWTEHFDSNDRVFYYNATTRVSSWTHPLEHVYRETYKTIVNFRNSNMAPPERLDKLHDLQAEVTQMEKEVQKEISQWTEHCDEQGNRFYFNREERQSTWTDPRPAKCQILHLRQKMLHLLQSNAGATAGFSDGNKADGSSRFGPIGVAARQEDPATKRPKVAGGVDTDPAPMRSPEARSECPTDHANSDSESDEERKRKKKKKKKHKKKDKAGSGGEDNGHCGGIRLGAPIKLGSSASEPAVGYKPQEDKGGGAASSSAGMGRSPRTSGVGHAHPALGGLSPLDESGLSMAGRSRVKAGIRLEPIGPGGEGPPPPSGSGPGVRNSASVPSL